MKFHRRTFLHLAAGVVALPTLPRTACAQTYPTRPVRVIVPVAPGGQTDVIARLVAQKLSERLGQQYYVENMPGAGGSIGTGRVAAAAPDGYTLLATDGIFFVSTPSLYNKVSDDTANDFAAVAAGGTTAQVLAVHPSVPASTIGELIVLIRANPGKYSYASAGVGTGAHLIGELFRLSLKLDLVHVPYGGGGPAIGATVGGHTPIAFGSPAAIIPHATEGKLRALAVAAKKRMRGLPNVPTMAEEGFGNIESDTWVGLLAPAKTPREIITRLNQETVRAVEQQDVKERLFGLGFEPASYTPEEMADIIKADIPKWAGVIRDAGIKSQ
jgi:tripartite-type tricarboxylate transporter receptor subunit TctC